jgi:hypothetical protein
MLMFSSLNFVDVV